MACLEPCRELCAGSSPAQKVFAVQQVDPVQVKRQKSVYRLLQLQANLACLEAGSELWAQCSPAQKKFTVQQVHQLLVEGRAAGKRSFRKPTNGQVQQSADIIVLEYEVLAALKCLCGSLMSKLPTQSSCVMWRGSSTKTFCP